MDCTSIIMNYTIPPSIDDLEALCSAVIKNIPDELSRHCESIVVVIEDMPDDIVQDDNGVDDPFELLAIFKSGKEVSPGIEAKISNNEDVLTLYRRSILDFWCESGEDLQALIRQVIIDELGRCFEFSDDDIQDMSDRLY